MCVGVPMQVVECEENRALCAGRGTREWLDTRLVGAVAPGDWLLAFCGAAHEKLDAARAAAMLDAFAALEAALSGQYDAGDFFADLDRDPQLPAHLRKPV
ncbi:HypC/HybG/HupF family hydrogenase formation chaperone [Crenobacter caeni]|uniref:HypC/HybG/HupF family hydrogenase formation chaperone n=1 Tax=Crenobacter caeni TaxID=2705474 RepID=A0A6B2KUQ0_9NEIS|nr:HypC/HybG/HupF family hydrogenase formation chaperone [Crenobacter caeni]NDV13985.1 HypC/HybG/HupF family hydrogenase formation chaperone [Crenobacter caeni]